MPLSTFYSTEFLSLKNLKTTLKHCVLN